MATHTETTAPTESAEWVREKVATTKYLPSRQTLRKLRASGKIRAVSLQDDGEKRGIVLYNVESIRAYISQMEEKAKAAAGREAQ